MFLKKGQVSSDLIQCRGQPQDQLGKNHQRASLANSHQSAHCRCQSDAKFTASFFSIPLEPARRGNSPIHLRCRCPCFLLLWVKECRNGNWDRSAADARSHAFPATLPTKCEALACLQQSPEPMISSCNREPLRTCGARCASSSANTKTLRGD